MEVNKCDQFKIANTYQKYEVVGKWGKDIVLASIYMDNNDCLIYSLSEIEQLVKAGKLIRTRRHAK
ncbi:hypothetical protein EAL2_c19820 [Peptoclostridium acidaminophilum DSM 3953]|uniref:Uncharacterized protein n=1 Tax=Peptoclostridium acidaminophilum DSM 3953 TaxID=1286171 RepID=W8THG3_PEPAC|nr:hypothetical protein [Peptoclostridium acidaminophilum]AHM57263.1 hypothetical protein EAL2_c19820 [Peptoclostridium acidaminophilum DSM 3953]